MPNISAYVIWLVLYLHIDTDILQFYIYIYPEQISDNVWLAMSSHAVLPSFLSLIPREQQKRDKKLFLLSFIPVQIYAPLLFCIAL